MAKCWTCGSSVSDYHYRCLACEDVLRDIESSLSEGLVNLTEFQERGFNQLSSDLSEVSSILEWGFEELSWRLEQQTEVLRNIDHTLRTPSETKANEWRIHAEELRRRGVLEEAEEFFLKALNEYRLDYRIYVGLAETYLQINKFDKAKSFLEKSLPHAPKGCISMTQTPQVGRVYPQSKVVSVKKFGVFVEFTSGIEGFCHISELSDGYVKNVDSVCKVGDVISVKLLAIDDQGRFKMSRKAALVELGGADSVRSETALDFDWKSYSYRLIGHIDACEENYIKALEALHLAIKLSPNYVDGLYDFAQYISLVDDKVVDRICSQTFQEWGNNWALKNYGLVCLLALQKAVKAKPIYFYLAQKEKNFERRRKNVKLALENLLDNACRRVETITAKINCALEEINIVISEAKLASDKFRDADAELESKHIYEDAESKLKLAKDSVASGDYLKILKAEKIANEACSLFERSKDKACSERDCFNNTFKERIKSAFDFGAIVGISTTFAFLFGFGGCIIQAAKPTTIDNVNEVYSHAFSTFFTTGFYSFFIIAIGIILYQIYSICIKKPLFKQSED